MENFIPKKFKTLEYCCFENIVHCAPFAAMQCKPLTKFTSPNVQAEECSLNRPQKSIWPHMLHNRLTKLKELNY